MKKAILPLIEQGKLDLKVVIRQVSHMWDVKAYYTSSSLSFRRSLNPGTPPQRSFTRRRSASLPSSLLMLVNSEAELIWKRLLTLLSS